MTVDMKPSLGEMTWMNGRGGRTRKPRIEKIRARLALLPAVAIIGIVTWTMLSGPSGAEDDLAPSPSPVLRSAQNTSWFDPVITRVRATLVTPAATIPPAAAVPAATAPGQDNSFNPATAEAIAPEETAPVDGLKISSQSWRRGGLGSKALVTFTLRNGNDYAVKDIAIACAFSRRDGSHLTDRTRVIHDVVNMKSRKTFARMHVGFVNINANKAKCQLVAASRL